MNNDVTVHMSTDDALVAPPPLMRELGGLGALRAVTDMWAQPASAMEAVCKSHVMQER